MLRNGPWMKAEVCLWVLEQSLCHECGIYYISAFTHQHWHVLMRQMFPKIQYFMQRYITAITIAAFYPWCLCAWIFVRRANNTVVLHCITNLLVFIRSIQASWVICFYHLAFIIGFSSKYLKLDQIFSPVFILARFINIIVRYLDINPTIYLFWYSDEIFMNHTGMSDVFCFWQKSDISVSPGLFFSFCHRELLLLG